MKIIKTQICQENLKKIIINLNKMINQKIDHYKKRIVMKNNKMQYIKLKKNKMKKQKKKKYLYMEN